MKTVSIVGDNYFGYWDKQRIACRGIIIEDDMILLSYAGKLDVWMLPGGGLEDGESAEGCCVREVSEETGITIEPYECVLEIDEYYENCKYMTMYYLGKITGKCDRKLTDMEISQEMVPHWLPVEEALDVFSRHADYADRDEMKRGLYLREYTALKELK